MGAVQQTASINPPAAEDQGPGIWIRVTGLQVEDVRRLKTELEQTVVAEVGDRGKVSAGIASAYKLDILDTLPAA